MTYEDKVRLLKDMDIISNDTGKVLLQYQKFYIKDTRSNVFIYWDCDVVNGSRSVVFWEPL